MRKTIKIKFCDGLLENDLVFLPILRKHYDVVFSDEPEYLFYSVFGREHLEYDCIKIFTTGEAVSPNFNECDYATAFDYMEFGDRYLRLPLCSIMYRNGKNVMDDALLRGGHIDDVANRKFCSFVVSNSNGIPEREKIFKLLNEYRTVDSGGKFRNNVGGPVEDKMLFERGHKFSICFENERYPGYATEKITDAFAAGTVPIYLGDPEIGRMFNTDAFINVADYGSFEEAVEQVKRVDSDDALYRKMLAEPIFKGREPYEESEALERFLCHIIEQDLRDAGRRPKNSNARRVERPYGTGRFAKLCDTFHEKFGKLK